MLTLSETEMTGEETAVIYFKILSWKVKIMKNIMTANTQNNINMEVLWLDPTCAIDGTEWEITRNPLQSIKETIPVQKYYHKNSLHLYHNIILEVLEKSRLYNKTSLHSIKEYSCACIKITQFLYQNT
jgi:hypothetical protein